MLGLDQVTALFGIRISKFWGHGYVDKERPCQFSKQRMLRPNSHQPLQAPGRCDLRGTQDGEKHAYQRNAFNKPDLLPFPIQENTKIINLRCTFLWLAIIFWCSTTFFFFSSQKLLHIQAPPLPLWNSPSELAEWLYPRLKSSVSLLNKT